MSELRRRALELCAAIDLRSDLPTRADLLAEGCEDLLYLIHEARGIKELSDSWHDVAGFFAVHARDDFDFMRGLG